MSRNRFEAICLNCGEALAPPLGRGTRVKKYCTQKCKDDARNAARRTPASVHCPECGQARVLLNPSLAGGMCRECAAVRGRQAASARPRPTPAQRFMALVEIGSPCWLWTGSAASNGYGQFYFNGRMGIAHRFSYEWHIGPIPHELEIDHLCNTRLCVTPSHLEPVTHAENMRRKVLRDSQQG